MYRKLQYVLPLQTHLLIPNRQHLKGALEKVPYPFAPPALRASVVNIRA